ncbi:hypothetical protein C5167_000541 [Papaver somniferum]|uniref:IBB domain-containing protein n=1 Tax=Papaver somniferum TaxID=3469 RepID=A0A4Y7KVQ8_PAPSO|nr:hypothetical protein C5167_000541 [Papaver somniferum]
MRLFVDDSPQKKVRFPTLSGEKKLLTPRPLQRTGFFSVLESSMLSPSTTVYSFYLNPNFYEQSCPKAEEIVSLMLISACRRLVELLLHPSPTVLIHALHTVGSIVTGDDRQTQSVTVADIIDPLIHLLQNAEFDIKKEAAWAISNATSGGSHEQIKYVFVLFFLGSVLRGCIKPLCDLLIYPDARIVTVCLEGLENILKVGEVEKTIGNTDGVNLYAHMIDEAEGLEKIENLQSHDNTEIYEKAVKILETYWLEEEDEMPPPGDAAQTEFHCGGTQPQLPSDGFNFG